MNISIKTPADIEIMREGGLKLVEVLKQLKDSAQVGTKLKDLDELAKTSAEKLDAQVAFLGHEGYPAAICASVNEGIVHCIPDDYRLKEGDIISIDFGLIYKGFYTDSAFTMIIGQDIHNRLPLLKSTYKALMAGTNVVKAGITVGDISKAIEKSVKSDKLTIMRQFTGHGIGRKLHEPPIIPNFYGHDRDKVLPAGSTIAIEPIVSSGSEAYTTLPDGWSAIKDDYAPVAHFEHTLLVTPTGFEILTPLDQIIGFRY